MNKTQDIYLGLLRVALCVDNELTNDRVKELTNERVNELIQLAAFQGTGPLVYDQLLKLKELDLPSDLRVQMKQQCLQSMMLQQSMVPLLSKAWIALEKVDIHPVLLKGFGIAQYYPQPHLRQWGDIDIYVGQQNYHSACAVLRETFPDSEHGEVEDEEDKHYNFDFPNTAIETHRVSMTFAHPQDRKYYERLEELYLTKAGPKCEIEGLAVTQPEKTFNVFFVFLHAWHHFVGTGMNMKQVCDIAILLHIRKDYIDKEHLNEMLTKLHLMEAWQLIMYIMVHHLNMTEIECPFYTEKCRVRAELLFKHVLNEGSFYRREKISKGNSYLQRKYRTFLSRIVDSQRVYPFAPRYARHLLISYIFHGIERTLRGK